LLSKSSQRKRAAAMGWAAVTESFGSGELSGINHLVDRAR
jgi:hypothetical protein